MTYENPRTKAGKRPEKIVLNDRVFEFLVNQRGFESAIYKSNDSYLRIGKPEKINPNLELHKQMEAQGFPVAKLLEEGALGEELYFIESSLGNSHLGNVFAEEYKLHGSISAETFENFILIAEKFAQAQIATQSDHKDYSEFSRGIWLQHLCEEMPEHAGKLLERFQQIQEHTKNLPFIITHGDFNPNNLYSTGVIDLEDSFHGPYGYDLVSAIAHIDSFPDGDQYEHSARYRFTPGQKNLYFERLDQISVEAGLPALSEFKEDFEFSRAVWLAAGIPHVPKLQEFRFDSIIAKYL